MVATPHVNFDYPTARPRNGAGRRAPERRARARGDRARGAARRRGRGDEDRLARRPTSCGALGARRRRRRCSSSARTRPASRSSRSRSASSSATATASCSRTRSARRCSATTSSGCERLVDGGAMTVVNAGSLAGLLGDRSREAALDLVAAGPRARGRLRLARPGAPPARPARGVRGRRRGAAGLRRPDRLVRAGRPVGDHQRQAAAGAARSRQPPRRRRKKRFSFGRR